MHNVIVWDIETVPDLRGYANGLGARHGRSSQGRDRRAISEARLSFDRLHRRA